MRTKAEVLSDIAAVEAKQARPLREFALSGQWDTAALARIRELDTLIAGYREELRSIPEEVVAPAETTQQQ